MEGDRRAARRSHGSEPCALAGVLIPRMVPTEGLQPPTFGLQNRCTGAVLCRPNGVTGGTRIHFGRLHRAPPRLLRLPSHSKRRHRRSLVLPRSNTPRPSRSTRGRAPARGDRCTRGRASSYYNGGALRGRTACSVFAERRLHRLACAPIGEPSRICTLATKVGASCAAVTLRTQWLPREDSNLQRRD